MATHRGEPQLPRRVPAAVLALGLAVLTAADARAQYEPSGYEPFAGEPFFLLSDKQWASFEVAQVRLEVNPTSLESVADQGGVDVALYRVPKPIEFLAQQKNLHRVRTDVVVAEEGLANTLKHLWDRWYSATRQAWRRLFTPSARATVTVRAPELKTQPMPATRFIHPPQFKPLPGFDLVTRFRYPVHHAQPIQPPKDLVLQGSSSEFITPPEGNVMVPLGRLEPGLYLVEAAVGGHRANTLVFVSDTIAVTKTSAQEMVVWTAERTKGTAVAGVDVAWTDGAGVLQRGRTDLRGLVRLDHESPERSYVMGADPAGGVFISENFYYDSEIYDTKVYAVTDRPLYRPGDGVFVKVFAREFKNARESAPAAPGEIQLTVLDPAGAPVAHQRLVLRSDVGGDTSFRLPENAAAGGYEMRMAYRGSTYSAAFRVAQYTKPHFELAFVQDKDSFKVKEPVGSTVQLRYADGKPVANAEVQVTVRAQQLTMVDGELGYYGQFPVKLSSDVLKTDEKGEVRLDLPAAEVPSRYVVSLLASDGSASRVRATREILVERGRNSYSVKAQQQFSAPAQKVKFAIASVGDAAGAPVSWEWVRLEDRRRETGMITNAQEIEIAFADPGTYSLQIRDARGDVVGAASHWVSGGTLDAPAGSITLVASRERYRPGDTAEVLITFPTEVDDALLTMERDKVESTALLRGSASWVRAEKLSPTQWRARLRVDASYAPNITFSVAYVKDGEYVFQNQGLVVAQPRVEVTFKPKKPVYQPGETVEVEVQTKIDGKGRPAVVAVGVVDEMIYVLQPEIAPTVEEFFFHLRRNNVRTSSSLSFISYDLATSRSKGAPAGGSVSERRVKLLERPRRDEVDTAFWNPTLQTDSGGKAKFTFVMPDALTRWRITGRAMASDGTVGQRTAYLRSEKSVYLKWTSPQWMRTGDTPQATIAAFNQTGRPITVDLAVGGRLQRQEKVTLQPGINVLPQSLTDVKEGAITVALADNGKVLDALETRFEVRPVQWRSPRTLSVKVDGGSAPLALPADARDVEVALATDAASQFRRVADDLIEYPYGCIEQTASRMIPLSIALRSLGPQEQRVADRLRQRLNGQRLRLAYMAGPKATFTWWGIGTTEDPFLTSYAYFADWIAVGTLNASLPADHWSRLLEVYKDSGHALPMPQRALMLAFMQDMGLPTKSLVEAFLDDLAKLPPAAPSTEPLADSPILGHPDGELARAFAVLTAERLAQKAELPAPPNVDAAVAALKASGHPLGRAMLLASHRLPESEAAAILERVSREMPTMERALTLAMVWNAVAPASPAPLPGLAAPWIRTVHDSGAVTWRWPAGTPLPSDLVLASPAHGLEASVHYTSAAPEESKLPVDVERTLWKLVKTDDEEEPWTLEPVEDGEAYATDGLYLDEISITSREGTPRYGVLEVPLPPGAEVEETTWGISLPNREGELEALEKARHQDTSFGYAVPVDPIGNVRVRHLVRFGQRGTFVMPRARVYRMYLPEAKAYEDAPAATRWVVR